MSDLKRVRKIINWLIFQEFASNEKELAEMMGYTKSSFSQLVNGKVPLSDKFIDNLAQIDENVNKVWIKEGVGNMLNSNIIQGDRNAMANNSGTVSGQNIVGGGVGGHVVSIAQDAEFDKIIREKEIEITRGAKSNLEVQRTIDDLTSKIENMKEVINIKDELIESLRDTIKILQNK